MKIVSLKQSCAGVFLLGSVLTGGLMFSASTSAAELAEEKTKIPATSEAIWQAIDAETEQLTALIQGGKLAEVHHHAFAIRDMVLALPAHSASLGPEKIAQIKANTKFVVTLAERLDATGDAKDKAGTESNFQKLKGILKTIRANYPAVVQK